MRIVDDLLANVDRVGESIQGDLDDIDRSHHTGTKTPRAHEKNVLDHVNPILTRTREARMYALPAPSRFQVRFGTSGLWPAVWDLKF